MNDAYDTYQQWKGWDREDGEAPEFQKLYFRKQLERYGIKPPGNLLEVGFGNGGLLRAAKEWGFEVNGIEILPELVEKARDQGFEAQCADITSDSFDLGVDEGRYDVIVALDVLEHLPVVASNRFLTVLGKMLKPEGRLLLRFPNGGSPAGLLLQNGDHTHRQAITESKLRQLSCGTGVEVDRFENTIRKIDKRSRSWWLRPMVFALRNVGEFVYGYLYVGRRVPLDKSCVAVLKRS